MILIDRQHVLAAVVGLALVTAPAARAAAPRVVEITGNDQMKYSVASITAKPGETLTLRLKNVGKLPKAIMGHNVVVLVKGADAKAFATAAATARDTDYIPAAKKDQILAATKIVGPGETAEITFTVPKAPGDYTYLCTFPGHFLAGMTGTLTVK